MGSSPTIFMAFVFYTAVMLIIGYVAYKRTSDAKDYFLGGRTLGPWPAALSAGASDMSGWLMMGLPGAAYVGGISASWIAIGLLLGTWLNWLFCAKRLRTYSITADDAITLPEFFAKRFDDPKRLIQGVSAVFILLFFLFYTSSGFVAGGKLFASVFDMNYQLAVLIGAISVLSYTLFGGFLAVAWTDLAQGLMMLAAMLIVPVVAMQMTGVDPFGALSAKNPDYFNMFYSIKNHQSLSFVAIASMLAWGLGYFGQPHILVRFQATRSNRDIGKARRIAVLWSGLSLVGAICVGLIGILYADQHLSAPLQDGEQIFMILVRALFNPLMAGILLAAILAAIMSTVSSQLLVCSSALAEDIYKSLLFPDASQKTILNIGRLVVVVLSAIAVALALNPNSSVLNLVSYAWAGFGAAFGPLMILSLFWKRLNYQGALAGIIVGALTVVLWKLVGTPWGMYELIPGFVFSLVSIVVVALITPKPSQVVVERFEKFSSNLQTFD